MRAHILALVAASAAAQMTFQKMGSGTPAERVSGSWDRRVRGRRDAEAVPPKRRAITSGVLREVPVAGEEYWYGAPER